MPKRELVIAGIIWSFILICSTWALEFEFNLDEITEQDVLPSALIKCAEDAYEKNLKGLDALKAGKYNEAQEFFKQAFALLPGYWDAENNRGVAYFRKGNVVAAEKIWKEINKQDPKYSIAYYNLGIMAFHEKKYDKARTFLKQAMKRRRNFAEALAMLGRIEIQAGNKKVALNHLAKAFRHNPTNQSIWGYYAYVLMHTGDTSKTVDILERQKKSPDALQMLGQIARVRKDYKKAIQYFTQSMSLGGSADGLYQIAEAELEQGSCRKALNILLQYFAKTKKTHADAFLIAGIAAQECNNLKLAKEYFSKGLTAYPHDPILRFNLGHMHLNEKNYQKAEKIWSPLADTMQDPRLFHLRALAAYHLGKLAAAETLINKALRLDTKAEYLDFLGTLFFQKGRRQDAIIQFKKALALNPDLRSAQLNLALADNTASAQNLAPRIQQIEKRLNNCSQDCADIALELAVLYYHTKDIQAAIQVLKKIPDNSHSEMTYRHLALFLNEQQQWHEAIKILESAKNKLVLSQQTEAQLIESYLNAGFYNKAITILKELVVHWQGNLWRLYYQIGYAYFKINKLDLALQNFKKSLKCQRNAGARGMMAFIHNLKGNSDQARKLWEYNLREDPDNPVLWINMALLLEKEGKYRGAIANYEKALSLDRTNKAVYLNIGNAYAAIKKYRDARMSYEMALNSSHREFAAYNTLIAAYGEKNRTAANKMLEILENEYAQSTYYLRGKAEILLWDKDTVTATSMLERINNKNDEDHYSLAHSYITLGKVNEAQEYIQKLPQTSQWKNALGLLHASLSFAKGDYNDALEQFRAMQDTGFICQYNTALAAYKAGYYNQTKTILRKYINEVYGKDKADVCRLMGNASFALEQWQDARAWYLQLSVIELQNPLVQYNLAVSLYNLNKIEEAWKYYQNARSLDPQILNKDIEKRYHHALAASKEGDSEADSINLLFSQAVDLQNQGKDTLAENIYHQILAKEKDHHQSMNNLGTLYGTRADFKKAEEYYLKAIAHQHDLVEAYINLIKIYIAIGELKKAKSCMLKGKVKIPFNTQLLALEEELQQALKAEKKEGNSSLKASKE